MTNTRSKNTNKISVVIVTYNSSGSIIELLESLRYSKQIIKEVIIIENNSPDRKLTQKYILKYSKKYKSLNIGYIQSKNNDGFAKSSNRGAKKTTGQYILFINPDTKLRKNSLAILLKHAISSRASIAGGIAINREGDPHNAAVRAPTIFTGLFEFTNLGKIFRSSYAHKHFYYKDINLLQSKKDIIVDAVSGAFFLVKKESFSKLNGFDEDFFMYLEDVDIGVRAGEMNMKVIFCPHSIIFHEGGASSINKYNIHHQAWYDSRKKYYRKHFRFALNIIIQPLFSLEEAILKKIRPET